MILDYIRPENVIILAVTPINADMATSEALKLAKIVDPEGKRTLAVLTKLDLMDPGTDANEAMAGHVIPVKLGIIGVVNRSQQDIKDKKLLMGHLKAHLPKYKVLINKKIAEQEELLTALGEEILPENKHKMLRELINKVVKEFCGRIDGQAMPDFAEGTAGDMKLSGGAKINRDIFYGSFKEDLDEIIPLADVTQFHIIQMLRSTAGLQPHVFVSDEVFMKLARKEVGRLSKPSERCVERVHDELRTLIEKYGPECKRDFDRFPRCRDKIIGITQEFVSRTKKDALLLVKDLVNVSFTLAQVLPTESPTVFLRLTNLVFVQIQTGFINTRHKDFQEEAAVLLSTQQRRRLEQEEAKKEAEHAKKDWVDDGYHPKSFHAIAAIKALGEKQKNRGEGSGDADRWLAEEREMEDGDMMRELAQKYFGIARDAIEDGVPKAIFQKLIQPVKNGLQTELYEELVVSGLGTDLLEETGDAEASRKEAKHTLEGLLQAFDIIHEVREFNV
ncbi:hypothetical protein RvY_03564-1 [Ramazzottius varieornatus]|uniref:Dynamin-type G domain-containing protein n=1 Tax=Ramazzottius varieornatus TaxID=947166 RepID=A0A1D1UNI8_RAMVA|nr:hypothetical protein RvY_03564-1 [Ramazzottius varieornatus]